MFPSDPDRRAALDRDPARDRIKREALRRWHRAQQSEARQYAHRMQALADLATAFRNDHEREVILEAAGTARMGQLSAVTQLENARRLRENFPQALAMLKAGRIFVRTVQIVLQLTKNASDAVQYELGRRVLLEIAEWDAADVRRRVAAVLPQVEAELEEQAQRARHQRAKANRGMWVMPVQDGMARVGMETDQLSAAQFAAGFDVLDRAQAALDRRDGVTRGAGQRRADLLTELPARLLALTATIQQGSTEALLAEAAARNTAGADEGEVAPRAWELELTELQIQLLRIPVKSGVVLNAHVPVTTLLELDQRALRLDTRGASYLPAFHARALLPTAALRRVVVDHLTGIPLAVEQVVLPPPEQGSVELDGNAHRCGFRGTPPRATRRLSPNQRAERDRERAMRLQRRRLFAMCSAYVALDESEHRHDASTALRTLVRLRDQSCRGVGCTRHAGACDLDHRQDWAKGGQTAAWNLDAESPRCHHSKDSGWVPDRNESTGVMTWTSALGSTYTRQPAWDPPPEIADTAQIPHRITPPGPAPARDRDEDPDRPLWRDPAHEPTEGARRHEPEPAPEEPANRPQWDVGPPPF